VNAVAYGGGAYIADKSAWEMARQPSIAAEWAQALHNGQIATCAITKLEILFSTRSAAEFEAWSEALSALHDIPITRTVCAAALSAMGTLASRSAGFHRIPLPDYLIAAAAEDAGIGVLHYDRHFDRLEEVFGFESRWIAPAGSVP
jgi:predicted nucleic acid-binding protein